MEEALKPKRINLMGSSVVLPMTLQLHLICSIKGVPFYILFKVDNMGSTCVYMLENGHHRWCVYGEGVGSGSLVKNRLVEYMCPIQEGKTLQPSWWRCIVDQTPFSVENSVSSVLSISIWNAKWCKSQRKATHGSV